MNILPDGDLLQEAVNNLFALILGTCIDEDKYQEDSDILFHRWYFVGPHRFQLTAAKGF